MKIAIFENIMTPGGHEVDFDRILVEELTGLGHEVSFYVPEGFRFGMDYHVPVTYLAGASVQYTSARGIKKVFLSIRREQRRFGWYRKLYAAAETGAFDALIVPTSTYRYLRALTHSVLRRSPVPIIFIQHGVNPREAPKFLDAADQLAPYPNIRPTVITFGETIFDQRRSNIHTVLPPAFIPRDIKVESSPLLRKDEPITIGFFGQFRREKRLEDFLRVYLAGHYTRPVRLLVQGSTMHDEDAKEFDRIIAAYEGRGIEFLHRGLIGAEWQRAIADVDVLLMPYSAPRYRYHWGAMLFTAIGFQKPVLTSDDMNPEVFAEFEIGRTFRSGDMKALGKCLERFINEYDVNAPGYHAALARAAERYSPKTLAVRLTELMTHHENRGDR
ncbi:glycosyltransferase [Selenomonas sp. F0473]|uniref:glycosyltransferase n=1 Tax=Selenomonas sp. F0473 TaxID=999423 RepID=UPI00029EB267|nr:glycosyltransferase [Selenomonas sp. F0473]EKU70893.1 hypothetical protein HMPREF9161_01442 [Selenomonas sp. F0473]